LLGQWPDLRGLVQETTGRSVSLQQLVDVLPELGIVCANVIEILFAFDFGLKLGRRREDFPKIC